MKVHWIIISIMLLSIVSTSAQEHQLDWYVISYGGGDMSSLSYSNCGTLGQIMVGHSSSSLFEIESGFWVDAKGEQLCEFAIGDVNRSGNYDGLDIVYGVKYLKGGDPPKCNSCQFCSEWYYCGDVNGSCCYNGLDITYGIAFLKGGPALIPCSDCSLVTTNNKIFKIEPNTNIPAKLSQTTESIFFNRNKIK